MKTCKKILAGILVFAMMMSMCAFVSADGVETATDVLLFTNNFEEKAIGDKLNGSGNWPNSTDKTAKLSSPFFAKAASPSNKLTATVVGDDTNKYLATTHNRLGYGPQLDDIEFKELGHSDALSVYSTSYDIMIPADDAYKANRRFAYVNVGAYETGKDKYNATIVTPYASIVNGKIIGSSANSNVLYSKELDYTYGEWVTMRIDAWINANNKISMAIYADDRLVYAADYKGTRTAVGLCSENIEFQYANITGGTTADSAASATGTIESTTNYDNIKVSLLTSGNELTAEDIAEWEAIDAAEAMAKTPQVTLHSYPANSLSGFIDGANKPVFVDEGTLGRSDVNQGIDTDEATKDAFVVVNNDYTNITSSSYKYMTVLSRKSFSKYVQKDVKNTFVYSMDLNFKDFNAQMYNTFSLGIEGQKTNDIQGSFTVGTDGNISFSHLTANKGSVVEGKLKSESRTVPAGAWINVKMVFEINYGETQYAIKMFGIYEDSVIYENEFTLAHNEPNDGKGISVDTITFGIGRDNTTHTETVTGVQDIYFEKNNNFDWSAVNTDSWIDRTVSLTLDASGNVDVEAKKGGDETFTSGVLVVALYDAKGSLVDKVLTSSDISDGKFVYEVPAAKVATAKTIKGFVFDSITSIVPQLKHGEIVIDTN